MESAGNLHESSRRQHQTAERTAVCQTSTAHRQPVVRVGHDRVQMRRSETVFRQGRRTEGNAKGYRSTISRMGETEGTSRPNSSEISETGRHSTVFLPAGPLESTGRAGLFRVQPVSETRRVVFDPILTTVYEDTVWTSDDYRAARIGPWMFAALDRFRFRRRIENFEQNYSRYVTDDEHRRSIRSLLRIE